MRDMNERLIKVMNAIIDTILLVLVILNIGIFWHASEHAVRGGPFASDCDESVKAMT